MIDIITVSNNLALGRTKAGLFGATCAVALKLFPRIAKVPPLGRAAEKGMMDV